MDVRQFIDNALTSNAVDSKTVLNDLLSARAFEALETRKVELAQSIFGGEGAPEEPGNTDEVESEEE
jgi:hypothetical protein